MCEDQWPRPNIWLGVSAENQEALDERAMHLLQTPAYVHFLSYEPALGPIDLKNVKGSAGAFYQILEPITGCGDSDRAAISWVIQGGESGHNARPMHIDWARSMRDQCKAAGIPFFFKQWGAWVNTGLRTSGTPGQFAIMSESGEFIKTDKYPRQFTMFGRFVLENVGKKASGNVLDGVQYLEYPA